MRIAHFDMASGAAGDMMVAALLDAGFPFESLLATLASLPLPGVRVGVEKTYRNSILVSRFLVETPGGDEERHLAEILELIGGLAASDRVRARVAAAFRLLAEAEAALHGCDVESIHFHEVGAADSIVDLVGVMAGLEHFGVDAVACGPIPMPHGTIRCAHGVIPNPAPAVLRLLSGFPFRPVDVDVEMVTPTAATVLRLLAPEGPPGDDFDGRDGARTIFRRSSDLRSAGLVPEAVGMGAGSRVIPGTPGFLRVAIGPVV